MKEVKIGESIKNLRELNNLTQTYVAQTLGISQAAYQKIEANRTLPNHEYLQKISRLFDVPIQKLEDFSKENILNKIIYGGVAIKNRLYL